MINTSVSSASAIRAATVPLFDGATGRTTLAIIANFIRRIPFVVSAVAGGASADSRAGGQASVAGGRAISAIRVFIIAPQVAYLGAIYYIVAAAFRGRAGAKILTAAVTGFLSGIAAGDATDGIIVA